MFAVETSSFVKRRFFFFFYRYFSLPRSKLKIAILRPYIYPYESCGYTYRLSAKKMSPFVEQRFLFFFLLPNRKKRKEKEKRTHTYIATLTLYNIVMYIRNEGYRIDDSYSVPYQCCDLMMYSIQIF